MTREQRREMRFEAIDEYTWLERIFATPCPTCKQPKGRPCLPVGPYPNRDTMVCASRINKAEVTQ